MKKFDKVLNYITSALGFLSLMSFAVSFLSLRYFGQK